MRLVAAFSWIALAATAHAQAITVRGVATDSATKRPVNGVVIEMAGDTRRYSARSDEAGEFQLRSVEPGSYRLVTRRIGFAPLIRQISVASGMGPVAIRLSPVPATLRAVRVRGEGMGIYGEVGASSTLKHIPGAKIQVAGANETTITDSSGSYFVAIERPGSYMVRVKAPGYADDMFVVQVRRDEVADGSRLLDLGEGRSIPEGLWKDFDQRLRWRSGNSAMPGGAEVRRAASSLEDAIERSAAVVQKGLRLSGSVCVLVNGSPRPGMPLDAIRPEEVTAIEVYARDQGAQFLQKGWIGPCSQTRRLVRNSKAPEIIRYVVIWTR